MADPPEEEEQNHKLGHAIVHHVIGDDEPVQMLEDGQASFGLGIEQKMVREAEDNGVGLNTALGVQEESVEPLAWLQALHMIGGHGVEQPCAVFARDFDAAAG